MHLSASFTRIEVAILLFVTLLLGVGIGAFAGGLPHPSLMQRNIFGLSGAVSCVIVIVLQIYRANKEWKLRTAN